MHKWMRNPREPLHHNLIPSLHQPTRIRLALVPQRITPSSIDNRARYALKIWRIQRIRILLHLLDLSLLCLWIS